MPSGNGVNGNAVNGKPTKQLGDPLCFHTAGKVLVPPPPAVNVYLQKTFHHSDSAATFAILPLIASLPG